MTLVAISSEYCFLFSDIFTSGKIWPVSQVLSPIQILSQIHNEYFFWQLCVFYVKFFLKSFFTKFLNLFLIFSLTNFKIKCNFLYFSTFGALAIVASIPVIPPKPDVFGQLCQLISIKSMLFMKIRIVILFSS